jgi:hypothetical protein
VTCGATPVPSLALRVRMGNDTAAYVDQCLQTFVVVFSDECRFLRNTIRMRAAGAPEEDMCQEAFQSGIDNRSGK